MDKTTADRIIGRAGMLALLYYPEIPADDQDYSLAGDIDWVLEGVPDLSIDDHLRELIAQVIIDPTGTRDRFTAAVYAAVADS